MSLLRARLLGLPWIVLVACSAPANQASFTEGTRLKAVYEEAEGAPPRFLSWYDPVLESDCKFIDVGLLDRLVCFPSDPVGSGSLFAIDTGSGLFVSFPDRVHFLARAPKPGDPCGTRVQLFSVVAGNLGPEIPLDTLVSGTYRPGTGPGRIVPLTIVASDGSVQVAGTTGRFQGSFGGEVYPQVMAEWVAWDTQREEMVSASAWNAWLVPVGSRWHPLTTYYVGHQFADDACSVPVAFASACPVRAKTASSWGPADACNVSSPTAFVELGPPMTFGAPTYSPDSVTGACTLDDFPNTHLDPTRAAFALGAPIPDAAFAEAREVRTGTKQLQLSQAGSVDGPGTYPVDFFDTVHGQACSAAPAADGSLRCLPSQSLTFIDVFGEFSDPACSAPVVRYEPNVCEPKRLFAARIEIFQSASGSTLRRHHVFPVGGRYLGTVYSRGDPAGECRPLDSAFQSDQVTFHELGPEAPPSDFAAVTYVHPS